MVSKHVTERTGKTVRRSREGAWRYAKLGRDNAGGQRDSQKVRRVRGRACEFVGYIRKIRIRGGRAGSLIESGEPRRKQVQEDQKGNDIRSAGEDFALWLKHELACQPKYESERRSLKEGFCDGEGET